MAEVAKQRAIQIDNEPLTSGVCADFLFLLIGVIKILIQISKVQINGNCEADIKLQKLYMNIQTLTFCHAQEY